MAQVGSCVVDLSHLCKCTMLAPVRSAARPAVRTFSASPWGTDHWRHDKQAFKAWAKEASEPGSSKAKRELYGFLALSFGDVDTDKDGLINAEQFDQLLAEVADLPRRYGLAPLDDGDAVSRTVQDFRDDAWLRFRHLEFPPMIADVQLPKIAFLEALCRFFQPGTIPF